MASLSISCRKTSLGYRLKFNRASASFAEVTLMDASPHAASSKIKKFLEDWDKLKVK